MTRRFDVTTMKVVSWYSNILACINRSEMSSAVLSLEPQLCDAKP